MVYIFKIYLLLYNNFTISKNAAKNNRQDSRQKKKILQDRNSNLKSKPKLSTTGLINITMYNQSTSEDGQLRLMEQRRDVSKERDTKVV